MAEQSRQDRRGNREARPPRTALHDHAWTDAFIHRIHPWIGRYMERPTQDGEGKARQASNLQQLHRLHHPASIAQSKLRRAGSDTSTSRHETSSAMLAQRRAHATETRARLARHGPPRARHLAQSCPETSSNSGTLYVMTRGEICSWLERSSACAGRRPVDQGRCACADASNTSAPEFSHERHYIGDAHRRSVHAFLSSIRQSIRANISASCCWNSP